MQPFAQQFAVLGDRHPGLESCRQSKQSQCVVRHRHMIADEHERPAKVAQMFHASDSRPAHDARCRQDDQIDEHDPEPAYWPALLPAWIGVWRRFFVLAFTNYLLNLAERGCISEGRFVDLDLIAVLDGA